MLRHFFKHFAQPRGVPGRLAGALMARKNAPVNRWVAGLAAVQPGERVVEVGCGPGVLLDLLCQAATEGRVVGVDASPVMAASASRRNTRGIRQGRIEVQRAEAERLPLPSDHFHVACSVNSVPHWASIKDGLAELHRVLVPGGRAVLALRMHSPNAGKFSAAAHGSKSERISLLRQALHDSGFREIDTLATTLGQETTTALLARAR